DEIKTRKQQRHDKEKEAAKKGDIPSYPPSDQLRAEAEEEPPSILLTISDSMGQPIRNLTGPVGKGMHRGNWNFRYPAASLPRPRPTDIDEDLPSEPPSGPLVMPGKYKAAFFQRVDGVTTPLAEPQEFTIVVDGAERMELADLRELSEFQQR